MAGFLSQKKLGVVAEIWGENHSALLEAGANQEEMTTWSRPPRQLKTATEKLTGKAGLGYEKPYRIQCGYFKRCRNGDGFGKQSCAGGIAGKPCSLCRSWLRMLKEDKRADYYRSPTRTESPPPFTKLPASAFSIWSGNCAKDNPQAFG